MCGIAGSYGDPEKVYKMIPHIERRGNGVAMSYVDDCIGIAHNRLKLVGDCLQPLENERYVLSANCELYNYKELKSKLDYSFHTTGDTEVLLAGLTIEGFDFLNKINGDFAFSLYDKQTKELHLVRDRYGIRQLFYYKGKNFYFASDVKTILSVCPKEIDYQALSFNFKYKTSPKPIFKDVHKVGEGCVYTLGKGEYKWYHLPEKEIDISYEEAVEESDYLIKDSVRLRHHDSLAVMLGGLDSSLLYKYSNATPYNLRGKDTSNALDVCESTWIVEDGYSEADMDIMTLCFEQPYYSFSPQWVIARHIKEDVVFSGLGPDELLGGYHYYNEPYGLDAFIKQFTLFEQEIFCPVDCLFTEEKQDGYKTMNYYDITHYLANHHLYRGDQDLMHFTKEGRYPYLDHRLVEFWYNLPTEFKKDKRILQDIYGTVKKNGFTASKPPQEWIDDNVSAFKKIVDIKDLNYNQSIHVAMCNRLLDII